METAAPTAAFEKYPAYKESGEIWLPKIPLHWDMKKGKLLFNKEERPARDEDEIVTCFRDGQVTLRANRRTEGFTTALKEHGYQGIRKGDLVIHAMDAFAGAIGVSDSDGKSTPVYSVCTPKNTSQVNQFFYAYFLRNMATSNIILALAKGIRERSTDFRFKDFGELKIAFPPLPEQTAIAQFLDDKTAKIDRAIAQKEKLITLLKERKQIIIQDLVTGKKVWNPAQNAFTAPTRVKPSGVEWIGEIPEGWEVRRFRFLCSITTGSKNTEDKKANGYYPFFVRSQTPEKIDSYSFEGEAILTAGDGAGVGKVFHYINGKFDFHQRVYKFSDFKEVAGKFLFYYLQSNFSNVALNGEAKSTVDSLRLPLIQNFLVSIPDISIQMEIVEQIESQSMKIDKAINLQEQQIEKLKELKSSLIDSAVTGKIKVG